MVGSKSLILNLPFGVDSLMAVIHIGTLFALTPVIYTSCVIWPTAVIYASHVIYRFEWSINDGQQMTINDSAAK